MNRVQQNYNDNVKASLVKKFGYTSVMQVPKLAKIVVFIIFSLGGCPYFNYIINHYD